MEYHLNITGLFKDEEELRATIRKRQICYDSEPYYQPNEEGSLTQIGFQINLYGTIPDTDWEDDLDKRRPELLDVFRDVRKVAEALKQTGESLHIGASEIEDSASVSFSDERGRRPDMSVHIQLFNQEQFGRPVDDRLREIVSVAGKILEQAGAQKTRWHD